MNNDNPRLRLGILGIVIVSLFAALFARLWYLQIMATKEFKSAAAALQTRTILEEAPRGRVLDRNGVVLVDNRISVIVTVDGKKLGDIKKHSVTAYNDLIDRLATEITRYMPAQPIDRAFLEHRLTDPRFSPYLPIPRTSCP